MNLLIRLCAFSVLLFFLACNSPVQHVGELTLYSDLETTTLIDEKPRFLTSEPTIYLENANQASTDYARSGSHSIKLDTINKYGLNCHVEGLETNEFIEISVWQKTGALDGTLMAYLQGDNKSFLYRTYFNPLDKGTDGWFQHNLSFVVVDGIEEMDVYLFSGGKITYFDDFSLTKSKELPKNDLSLQLNLTFPDSSRQIMDEYIRHAGGLETIPDTDKGYVSASILDGNDTASVQVKLKGDWTDHLKLGKESFRIKIESDHAFNGLKSFSIQHPQCRSYLDEWVVHKLADQEDMLTTDFDFVNVSVDGINRGIYALEEHFDRQLLMSRNRVEGPILKWDESGYWEGRTQLQSYDQIKGLPYFQQSPEAVFKKNRTMESETLRKQFSEGRKLLRLFKNGHSSLEDIFDIDKLAQFYVLMELSSADHGLRWHNRRFYYNPVTQKLEHITYDVLPFMNKRHFICRILDKLKRSTFSPEFGYDNAVLQHRLFKKKYLYYLEQRTRPAYLDSFFTTVENELKINLAAIQGENKGYHFDREIYYENASFLRSQIPILDTLWEKRLRANDWGEYWNGKQDFFPPKEQYFIKGLSLNAYLDKKDSVYEICVENYHLSDITIYGTLPEGRDAEPVLIEKELTVPAFSGKADTLVFTVGHKPKALYVTASNIPQLIVAVPVIPWTCPKGNTVRNDLTAHFSETSLLYSIKANEVVFFGEQVIDEMIVVPDDYVVRIMPGTRLKFENNGGLVVSNSFFAEGTIQNPIHIFCEDSTANGLTILNGDEAVLKYISFEGLSALNQKKWELKGGITFYGTNVQMENCAVYGSLAEQALSIIRSTFEITDLKIENTAGDGLNTAFSSGTVVNSSFFAINDDALDFKGTSVTIENTDIQHCKGNGILGKEKASVKMNNVTIGYVKRGVSARDLSTVVGDNVLISEAIIGCKAFKRKPEFGIATIRLTNSQMLKVKDKRFQEADCLVEFN